MKALIYAEHRDGELKKITFENISLAKSLDIPFEVIAIGGEIPNIEIELGKYGAAKVHLYQSPLLSAYTSDGYAKILARAAREHNAEVIIMGATATGKDLASRLSVLLNAAMATDCTKIEREGDSLKITRPMYAGKVLANIRLTSPIKIVTIRPNVFQAVESAVDCSVDANPVDTVDFKTVVKEIISGAKGKLDVSEADIIVSGGRGMKGLENWHLIEGLAEQFGAATGASRAVVDAGWRPHDEQVGQTGKTVSPSLYVAVGISGAIQHLAGMSSSKYIVAINKDPEAPIFKVADYGIVADLFEIVPRMIDELKAGK